VTTQQLLLSTMMYNSDRTSYGFVLDPPLSTGEFKISVTMLAARLQTARALIVRSVVSTRSGKLRLLPSIPHAPQHALRPQSYTTFVPTPLQVQQPISSIFSTFKNWFEEAIWQMSSTLKKRRSKMNKYVMGRCNLLRLLISCFNFIGP
jgi:hypothetical protein